MGYLPWVTSNQTESYQSLQLAISSQEGTNPVNKDSVYMERRQLPEKNSMVNQVKTLRDIGNSHNSHHQLLRQSSVREIKASVMECPSLAYWRGLSFSEICSTSLLRANPSMTLARVHVREIVPKLINNSC